MSTSSEQDSGGTPLTGIGGTTLAASGTTRLTVDPDQVLAVAKIVSDKADELSAALMQHELALRIDPPSENLVSGYVAEAWNAAVVDNDDSQLARAKAYLRTLHQLALQLREAAERYQLDDEEAAAAFEDRSAHW
ncbi:MAG: hypothetical protein GEV04_05290 [Actinophytocola sp.]|nr:hypothetical protein [Actinophytocola sp.]